MQSDLEKLLNLNYQSPHTPAVISSDKIITYEELEIQSSALALKLSENISGNEYVGIYLDNSPDYITAIVALWKLGAVPVPLNLLAAEDELLKVVSITSLKTIITDKIRSQQIKHLGSVDIIPIDLQKIDFEKPSQRFIISEFNENDEAVVIFTSGSSGGPKGVVHTFHSLLGSIVNGNEIFKHKPSDRWLASLPFYHIGGFQIICRALYYKAAVIIPQSLQTEEITEAINEFKPTHASFVSAQLKRLLDNQTKPNNEMRCSLIGGGFIDKKLMLDAKISGWHPVKVYGSSETASFVCALSENDIEEKGDSTGKPIGNNQIKIVDEKGIECPFQTEGEIVIKSDSLFKNYLNNESETKNKLKQDSYFTGDLGY
jgi:o-succinylbenzoate---CoA ligase